MKYFGIYLALLSASLLTGCNWFSNSQQSAPPYTAHYDFEAHCKHRVGTPRTALSTTQIVLRIDGTKKGSGPDWDEFKVEVQEKVTSQNGSTWAKVAETSTLDFQGDRISINIPSPQPNGQWSSNPSPPEYVTDFKSLLDDPGKFKNGAGLSSFNYRLVLKGGYYAANQWIPSQVRPTLDIHTSTAHACTSPSATDQN